MCPNFNKILKNKKVFFLGEYFKSLIDSINLTVHEGFQCFHEWLSRWNEQTIQFLMDI